jgi:hypothetical protein
MVIVAYLWTYYIFSNYIHIIIYLWNIGVNMIQMSVSFNLNWTEVYLNWMEGNTNTLDTTMIEYDNLPNPPTLD